jgi:hypothetical protein
MILALLVVMLLVLPAVLVGGVWAGRHGSRAEWLLAAAGSHPITRRE